MTVAAAAAVSSERASAESESAAVWRLRGAPPPGGGGSRWSQPPARWPPPGARPAHTTSTAPSSSARRGGSTGVTCCISSAPDIPRVPGGPPAEESADDPPAPPVAQGILRLALSRRSLSTRSVTSRALGPNSASSSQHAQKPPLCASCRSSPSAGARRGRERIPSAASAEGRSGRRAPGCDSSRGRPRAPDTELPATTCETAGSSVSSSCSLSSPSSSPSSSPALRFFPFFFLPPPFLPAALGAGLPAPAHPPGPQAPRIASPAGGSCTEGARARQPSSSTSRWQRERRRIMTLASTGSTSDCVCAAIDARRLGGAPAAPWSWVAKALTSSRIQLTAWSSVTHTASCRAWGSAAKPSPTRSPSIMWIGHPRSASMPVRLPWWHRSRLVMRRMCAPIRSSASRSFLRGDSMSHCSRRITGATVPSRFTHSSPFTVRAAAAGAFCSVSRMVMSEVSCPSGPRSPRKVPSNWSVMISASHCTMPSSRRCLSATTASSS
mmetsp:Transcript_40852/g.130441  ORF Transcript_40852/g.130441 Transcript_40852/m.130441 type:complete len:496 (-) Transcript_40852:1939-3426(-)